MNVQEKLKIMTYMKKLSIVLLFGLLCCVSCVEMDIPPKNIFTDESFLSNESGMDIYLSRMYSLMPFEEFRYGAWRGFNNSWLVAPGVEGTGEALNRDGICEAFTHEDNPYWGDAFVLLRSANYLLENLPEFRSSFPEPTYNHYLGEAYFVRATVFYAMAKRYGGAPLVTRVIPYPAEKDVLEEPRATEEATWNQVLDDYDRAIELLQPRSPKTGYANRYVALSFKSEAMLYAGSVAKYNETVTGRLTGFGSKTGVRVVGFAEDSWEAASKKYFREAYTAAREVMDNGGYSLYKRKTGDREAQYQNMVDMFSDLTSSENIYVKQYEFPALTHGFDAYSAPYIFRNPLSSGTCPSLDFLELYEGFERYPNGTVKVTTGNSNTQGTYLLYDKPMDFFANAEPRLRAYVIFPGDYFRNREMEIRAGVYTGATPISPLFTDYSYSTANSFYQQLPAAGAGGALKVSPNAGSDQTIVTLPDGSTMYAAGENGPFYNNGEGNLTGLYGRKWLNTDPSFAGGEGMSEQPFIIMRYAEVLLNAAEAGIELALAGESSPVPGDNLLQVATEAVNAIRERAGATLLTGSLPGTTEGRNTVRKERRKELPFEYKTLWDLRRWRVNHYESRDGFWGETRDKTIYSSADGVEYRFRGLYPFYSSQADKYFFDARFQWVSQKTFRYTTIDYYFAIPGDEVTKSPVIDQQPGR
jgi:hypothetical protein